MKKSTLLFHIFSFALFALSSSVFGQVPLANFSMSPNPVCSGNFIQITDLSTNAPTAWSYTVRTMGPGPGGNQILSTQNPTVMLNAAGIYSIILIASNSNGASVPVTQTIQVLAGPTGQLNPAFQTSCIGGSPLFISVSNIGNGGGSYTYSWSNGSTATSILVSPTISTIYTCVLTASNGCSISRTSTVIIGQPTVAVSSSPYSICPGSISILTAFGQAPGPFTYSWSTTATTNTIAANVAGVYDVTVTNSNGCVGVRSYTLGTATTLSLNATANPPTLCAGNTATLRVTGGNSYSWSNGATTANATVSPNTSTTYTVIGAAGTCTGMATVSISVSINPTLVVVSTPSVLCTGGSATLTASGASTYTWIPIGTSSPSIIVTPTVNSTYLVRGNNVGCPTKTATISLSVSPPPVLNISSSASIICAFENVALAASGANTYQWNNGSAAAVIIVNPGITTTYTVIGSSINNCQSSATITQSVAACDGISTNAPLDIIVKLFPNPNDGNFSIESSTALDIKILNEMGSVIKVMSLCDENDYHAEVDGLSAGLYIVESAANGRLARQKLVISK